VNAFLSFVRWDVALQARNGFYYASVFVALAMSALVLSVPALRAASEVWVPAVFVFNLIVTTFFFVTGLILLERDEGTLTALAVTAMNPSLYLASRIVSLTTLATLETVIIVAAGFRLPTGWVLMLLGCVTLGVFYTCVGTIVATRYASVNELLLPASCVVVLLMLPLVAHFGFQSRAVFMIHPVEPALTLLRAAYQPVSNAEVASAAAGAVFWSAVAYSMAQSRIIRMMRDTRATGGR
jgi:fluoroquinolone transport system permease protein